MHNVNKFSLMASTMSPKKVKHRKEDPILQSIILHTLIDPAVK